MYYLIFIFIVPFTFGLLTEVAVIFTVCPFPAFLAFTTPLLFTVAYFFLLDFHVSFLFVAFTGVIVALIFKDFPAFTVFFVAESLIFFTATFFVSDGLFPCFFVIVTKHVAVTLF